MKIIINFITANRSRKILFSLFVLLFLSYTLSSCKDENESKVIEFLSPDSYIVPHSGKLITFEFKTTTPWRIENNAKDKNGKHWIEPSKSYGLSGTHSITILINPNNEFYEREYTLIVASDTGTEIAGINIKQVRKTALKIATNIYTIDYEGGEIEIDAEANMSYDCAPRQTDISWLGVETSVPTKSFEKNSIKITVSPNPEPTERTGYIEVYAIEEASNERTIIDEIKVIQAGKSKITNERTDYAVSHTGGNLTISFDSNTQFDISISDPDWVSEVKTKASVSLSYKFDIKNNPTSDMRDAEITFTEKGNGIQHVVTVRQYSANYQVIPLEQPGTLAQKATPAEMSQIRNLVIDGYLNENDFATIRNQMTSLNNFDMRAIANKELPTGALQNVTSLGSILLAPALQKIGSYAFDGCQSLHSVSFGGNLSEIEGYAFRNCSSLGHFVIPKKLAKISPYMLAGCISLQEIVIPENITEIEKYAFSNCRKLTSVVIPDQVTVLGSGLAESEDNGGVFSGCSSLQNVSLSKNVKYISGRTFENCISLDNVDFKYITQIGAYAFKGCGALKTLRVLACKQFYTGAFEGCKSMTSFLLSSETNLIQDKVFRNCESLLTFNVPIQVTYIGDYTFAGCISLLSVGLHSDLTSIGNHAFDNCVVLNSINWPLSLKEIKSYAFKDCRGIAKVILGDNITCISTGSFKGCIAIIELSIGKNVSTIETEAFSGVPTLIVKCYRPTPPVIESSTSFTGTASSMLQVPNESVAAYKSADYWKEFYKIDGIK